MRTTLEIDDDVLMAAKEFARHRGSTAGKVLSELSRQALYPGDLGPAVKNGVPLLPDRPGAHPVSFETVERLLDEP